MMTYVRKQTNSPSTTSGWFLPSIGQLIYIKKKYAEIISKSFDKCGGAMGRGWQPLLEQYGSDCGKFI